MKMAARFHWPAKICQGLGRGVGHPCRIRTPTGHILFLVARWEVMVLFAVNLPHSAKATKLEHTTGTQSQPLRSIGAITQGLGITQIRITMSGFELLPPVQLKRAGLARGLVVRHRGLIVSLTIDFLHDGSVAPPRVGGVKFSVGYVLPHQRRLLPPGIALHARGLLALAGEDIDDWKRVALSDEAESRTLRLQRFHEAMHALIGSLSHWAVIVDTNEEGSLISRHCAGIEAGPAITNFFASGDYGSASALLLIPN